MTYKIKASAIAAANLTSESYGAIVRYHAAELAAWHEHMKRVEASRHLPREIPDPDQAPPEPGKEHEYVQRFVHNPDKHMAFPPPAAPPIIDEAVAREGFIADFEIEDDVTKPEPSLDERKAALLSEISAAEQGALARVMRPGKRRLAEIVWREVQLIPIEDRTEKQREAVTAAEALDALDRRIALHAATAMHDVEDLTEETIGAWSMPPFPE